MLANVAPLSRPVGFQLLKMEGPNGELVPGMCVETKGLRWGNEPARSLDKRFDECAACSSGVRFGDGDLNGV